MELERSGNVRAATMESPEESIEELVTTKKITIARNKAGRKAFMNNAPVDNFGIKEYHGCILGDVTVKVDCSALMKSLARNGSPHFLVGLDASPANAIASAIGSTLPSTPSRDLVQLYSTGGRKSGEAYAKICPALASNWISGDMVRQCKLKSKRRATKKSANYEGVLLISTAYLVELICPGKSCRHRFHIIENAPFRFDILYGVEFMEKTE